MRAPPLRARRSGQREHGDDPTEDNVGPLTHCAVACCSCLRSPRPRQQQQVWQKCRKQYSSSNFQKSSRPIGSRATTRPAPAASTLPRGRTRVRRTSASLSASVNHDGAAGVELRPRRGHLRRELHRHRRRDSPGDVRCGRGGARARPRDRGRGGELHGRPSGRRERPRGGPGRQDLRHGLRRQLRQALLLGRLPRV